jgi:type II secretory pathway component GspD/PulD (secretin)
MKTIRALALGLTLALASAGFAQQTFRLIFSNTDVADVLRAISIKTGANIIYSAQESLPISINVTVTGASEAIRAAASAAGLVHRLIGKNYIVASAANMRHALEPYGDRAYLSVEGPTPADAAKQLEDAIAWLTARPSGDQILVIGQPEDIIEARNQLELIEQRWMMSQPVNEVVFLKYAPSSQVSTMVKGMYPGVAAEAIGEADKPGGGIGLSGTRGEVMAAKDIIRQVDIPLSSMQPDVKYQVYNIRYSSGPILKEFIENANIDVSVIVGPESYSPLRPGFQPLSGASIGGSGAGGSTGSALGGATASGAGGAGGSGGAGGAGGSGGTGQGRRAWQVGDESKMLVIRGTQDQIDKTLALLAQVDVKPQQVMVEVQVLDVSPEKLEEYGVQWSWSPFKFLEAPPGTDVGGFNTNTRPVGFGTFSRVPWDVTALLTGLVTSKEARILAKPRVQVVDNDEANIFIGDTIRARVSQAGGLGTQTVDIVGFPVGIILLLRPRVNDDGNITMRVHPVVSTVTAIDSNNIPQTSSREAESTVMIKDGETMVIGGLIRDEYSKTISEIPLLAQLPLVGELFRHRSTNKRKSEILVFITPHIVKEGESYKPPAPQPKKEVGK